MSKKSLKKKSAPSPPISPVKKLSSALQKHHDPSIDSLNTEDVKLTNPLAAIKTLAKDKSSEIKEEEEFTDEESSQTANDEESSDSGDGEKGGKELESRAELMEPLNSLDLIADAMLKSSKSVDREDDEDEGLSEEEEEEEEEENSEKMDDDDDNKKQSNSPSSSGSVNDEKDIEKQSAQVSKKRKSGDRVGAGGDAEKERFKRIWSNEDELALLQGILDYKERNHVIPYAHVHAESLLNNVKDSLAISVSVHQINDKVRRLKKRYNNTATRKSLAKRSKFLDPHNAAVFDLSKKIWDNLKEECILLEKKVTRGRKEENVDKKKKEFNHFGGEYPSLNWFLRSEHSNITPVLQNLIPIANADKLEEKCKKLEMIDIQLNLQKIEFLSSAVKLIKESLAKC